MAGGGAARGLYAETGGGQFEPEAFFHRHLLWGAQLHGGPDLSAAQAAALAHCAYHIHR